MLPEREQSKTSLERRTPIRQIRGFSQSMPSQGSALFVASVSRAAFESDPDNLESN